MPDFTHLDEQGRARMVDVSAKAETARTAVARGKVLLAPATVALLRDNAIPKGDALATARIAGIMAAKKTSDLIPLCHPLPITHAAVDLTIVEDGVEIEAVASITGRTGVEMESLTAVAVAALTLYDMVKAVDKAAVITDIRLESKTGGKSGDFRRSPAP
jgi:cyclic pyranopterin phosphate synthase